MKNFFKKTGFLILTFMLLFNFASGCFAAAATLEDSKKLFQLINERLGYLRAIAAYKYVNHLPVDVPQQEQLVVNQTKQQAIQLSLNPNAVANLMEVQMIIEKQVKNTWIRHWKLHGFPNKDLYVEDFKNIQPKLLALDKQILQQIVVSQPLLHDNSEITRLRNQATNIIDVTYVTNAEKLKLFEALRQT